MSYALQAEGLVKRFGKTTALAGVDLAARPGTVLGVLGPNGAGKTTAIRVLATQLRPDGGRATVRGLDVVRDARRVRRLIGLTGQYASVDDDLTGAENLVLFGQLLDLRRAEARARAAGLLARFGLTEVADRRVAGYSGGMRRRLDLAASLVGHPAVVFLDEPTTGLDPVKRDDAWRMIRSLADDGVTVLLTTQYLEEADALADDISVIDHGKVIARGTPADLKQVVSGQAVAVRPADPGRLGEAAAVIRAATGREPDSASRGELTAPISGDAAFAEVVSRLEQAGIAVTELSLRLPSLNEVFFALTGRSAGNEETQEKAA
jgi:oleandomycin transport system ATP-binding protein